ncbi:hypothetical protein [Streptomyces sp. RP5T]|uniref:hypothetical protein n=1 Tax=Streptomyces sp. RP5T TaxID=2490848 RepID=UPI0021AE259F|nr:hypothetical protein [Streptomyces sp. RP5T]
MTEMDQGGQQPVDEHQLVLRTSTYGPLPLPGDEPGLLALVPQRANLSDEFSDHIGRQARDPPFADDHCTSRVPHHMTMINDQELDVSRPTMHELVKVVP